MEAFEKKHQKKKYERYKVKRNTPNACKLHGTCGEAGESEDEQKNEEHRQYDGDQAPEPPESLLSCKKEQNW